MDKKPKLLDKRRLIISGTSQINMKVLDQALKAVGTFEQINEVSMIKFLSKIFMYEPKVVILVHDKISDNIEFARHIRNNEYFFDLPIIAISNPENKENSSLKKKIESLNINYFFIPFNNLELSKVIKNGLDK